MPGEYRVSMSSEGFETLVPNVEIVAQAARHLNGTLNGGAPSASDAPEQDLRRTLDRTEGGVPRSRAGVGAPRGLLVRR